MAVVAGAAVLRLTRGFTFFYDDWSFILSAPDWSWASYLEPHNEHPSILFKLVYGTLLNTVGLRSYLPYMAVLLALHAVDAILLLEVVRRRAGISWEWRSRPSSWFLGLGQSSLCGPFSLHGSLRSLAAWERC